MLTIPLETLAYIIEKAREFDAEVPSDAEEGSNAADDVSGRSSSTRRTIRRPKSCAARSTASTSTSARNCSPSSGSAGATTMPGTGPRH